MAARISSPPENGLASPARRAATASARVRRFRARKRAGQALVTINVNPPFVDDLVALGWLSADEREDRSAVGTAFLAFAQHAWDFSRRAPALFKAPGVLTEDAQSGASTSLPRAGK